MATIIPTRVGDVLILETRKSFTIYVVGLITKDGQQSFHDRTNQDNVKTRTAAVACAKTLVKPGRRIFLQNIDTGSWSELTPGLERPRSGL
jgi:hypothetical protein